MRALKWLVPVLVLAGCRGNPEDLFFYLATVKDDAGAVQAGVEVKLFRSTSQSCYPAIGDVYGAGGEYELHATATTDADGQVLFELMRFELQTPDRMARCIRLSAERDGAVTEVGFWGNPVDLDVPALILWSGSRPTVEPIATGWRVTRPSVLPLPEKNVPGTVFPYDAPYDGTQTYYDWTIATETGTVWIDRATAEPFEVSRAMVSGADGAAVIVEALANVAVAGNPVFGQSGNQYFIRFTTAPVTLSNAGADALLSQGRTCFINGTSWDPCPATDGSFGVTFFEIPPFDPVTGPPLSNGDLFRIDLGALVSVDRIVLRNFGGASSGFVIEGSSDAETWTEVGAVPAIWELSPSPEPEPGFGVHPELRQHGLYHLVGLGALEPVRYLRFVGEDTDWIYSLAEISVFEISGS